MFATIAAARWSYGEDASLMLEIESLHAQIEKLRESDAAQVQKYHSLIREIQCVGKQRPTKQSTCKTRLETRRPLV